MRRDKEERECLRNAAKALEMCVTKKRVDPYWGESAAFWWRRYKRVAGKGSKNG